MSQPSPVFGWLALRWACGDKPNKIQGKSFSNLSSLSYLFFFKKKEKIMNLATHTHTKHRDTVKSEKKKKSRSQLENVQVMKNAVKVLEDNDTRDLESTFCVCFLSLSAPISVHWTCKHLTRKKKQTCTIVKTKTNSWGIDNRVPASWTIRKSLLKPQQEMFSGQYSCSFVQIKNKN